MSNVEHFHTKVKAVYATTRSGQTITVMCCSCKAYSLDGHEWYHTLEDLLQAEGFTLPEAA